MLFLLFCDLFHKVTVCLPLEIDEIYCEAVLWKMKRVVMDTFGSFVLHRPLSTRKLIKIPYESFICNWHVTNIIMGIEIAHLALRVA